MDRRALNLPAARVSPLKLAAEALADGGLIVLRMAAGTIFIAGFCRLTILQRDRYVIT